ncbi:MAG TPA: hypothetical protein PLX06_14400 [Fimbriimonadaceae bacterium]|nr:hypothetical protein [Fimbriimonadaceae bacterium]
MTRGRHVLSAGLWALMLGANAQQDVSSVKITDKPASGMVRGMAFFMTETELRISSSNSIQFSNRPEDRTRTFELKLEDRRRKDFVQSVAVRIIVDDKTKLDGRTFKWKPAKSGSPEDFAQRYPGGTSVGKLRRGVDRVVLYWLPHGHGTYESEEFRESYSVQVQFGKRKAGFLPGKIAVSCPDATKSYVVGSFRAELIGSARD